MVNNILKTLSTDKAFTFGAFILYNVSLTKEYTKVYDHCIGNNLCIYL